jgi:hypothetical protein
VAHLSAIEGSTKVPDLHGPDTPMPGAIGGLALAAASVSSTHIGAHKAWLTIVRWSGH